MNSQTIYLYSSAVAMIAVLIGFSRNNRKSGWKKTRTTLAGALRELYADLGLDVGSSERVPAPSPINSTDFTLQLLNLRGALGASNPIAATPAAARQEELLPARSR